MFNYHFMVGFLGDIIRLSSCYRLAFNYFVFTGNV